MTSAGLMIAIINSKLDAKNIQATAVISCWYRQSSQHRQQQKAQMA